MERQPLDTRDRRALGAVAVQFFVNGAMAASFLARAPQLRDRIGVSIGTFGVLLTVAGAVGVLGSSLAGRIVERMGTFRVLLVGALVMVVALPFVGLARSWWAFLVAMFAVVFVDVLVDIAMNLQGSWISARRHAPVMNRLHGVWSVGTLAGGLGAAGANAAGWSLPLHLGVTAAVCGGALAAALGFLLRDDEEGDAHRPAAAAPVRRSRWPFALLFVAGALAVVLEGTAAEWATFRLVDDLAASAALGSVAFVAYTVGMSVVRIGGDSLELRLGRDRLHHWSVAAATLGLAVATLVPDRWAAVAGFGLAGAGVATFMPTLYDDAARTPGRRGAGLGAMTAGMRIASLATPVLVGGLAGTSMSVGAAIAAVTLPAAVGFLAVTEAARRYVRGVPSAGSVR